jgi:hypothetical protein
MNVTIEDGVTSAGEYVFARCVALAAVALPASV